LGCTFRKLDAVSDRLKQLRVNSAFGSRDIAQAILDCLREISEQEQDYTVSRLVYSYGVCSLAQLHVQVLSLMRIEYSVQELRDNQERMIMAFPQTPGPRSVAQEMVFVRDATGREYKLLVEQCQSRTVSCVHQT